MNDTDSTTIGHRIQREEKGWLSELLLAATPLQLSAFAALAVVFSCIAILYFANLVRWSQEPDFGWSIIHQMGQTLLADVSGEAEKAGLKKGGVRRAPRVLLRPQGRYG